LWVGLAGAQSEALEAALQADTTNEEHCANLYTTDVGKAAAVPLAVSEVRQHVDRVYKKTKAPYLLFWRGVLAQCLGQEHAARNDLEGFIDSEKDSSKSVGLVRQALVRVRQLVGDMERSSFEAALQADTTNEEHCANLYTARVGQAAAATLAVAEVWQHVDQVYERTKAQYLLFWRGALAQCLGREDAASNDLQEFIDSQKDSSMFVGLVRQARVRVRRLVGSRTVGQGPTAKWIRRSNRFELDVSYGVGGGVQELACIDGDTGSYSYLNSVCVGGSTPESSYAGEFSLARVRLRIDGYPTQRFGIGARLGLDWSLPTNLPRDGDPGPFFTVAFGPQLRYQDSVASGGRAGWLRLELRFSAAFGSISPWGGSKYPIKGYLDVGTWALRHVGPAIWLSGAVEASPKVVIEAGGWFAWYVPMPGASSPQTAQPSPAEIRWQADGTTQDIESEPTRAEEVEILPEVEKTGRWVAGGKVALLIPKDRTGFAVGPFFSVDVQSAWIRFPNDEDDVWPADCGLAGDGTCRKVYSTRRLDLVARLGIEFRFGAEGSR